MKKKTRRRTAKAYQFTVLQHCHDKAQMRKEKHKHTHTNMKTIIFFPLSEKKTVFLSLRIDRMLCIYHSSTTDYRMLNIIVENHSMHRERKIESIGFRFDISVHIFYATMDERSENTDKPILLISTVP